MQNKEEITVTQEIFDKLAQEINTTSEFSFNDTQESIKKINNYLKKNNIKFQLKSNFNDNPEEVKNAITEFTQADIKDATAESLKAPLAKILLAAKTSGKYVGASFRFDSKMSEFLNKVAGIDNAQVTKKFNQHNLLNRTT